MGLTNFRIAMALAMAGIVSSGAVSARPTPLCEGEVGYSKDGTALIERTSPWMRTKPDIVGSPRSVQFRLFGMPYARYTYSNCSQGPRQAFPTAIQYRIAGRAGIGGWVNYSSSSSSQPRGWRWPNQCAGRDPVSGLWRTWNCL